MSPSRPTLENLFPDGQPEPESQTKPADVSAATPALREDPAADLSRKIRREITEGFCTLVFDRPESSANIFDSATLDELESHLSFLENQPEGAIRGVILISAKESVFVAGADLKQLQTLGPEGLRHFISRGQKLFLRLRMLPMPTVAAIHGACMGGGFEMALACDWRIATPDKATKIGLPEVNLGILPAWGGSTRLPRLIGLPKALDIILGGKTPSASTAKKLGMIDEIAPKEALAAAALSAVLGQSKSKRVAPPLHAALALALEPWVKRQILKKTHGNYPAALEALHVVCAACHGDAQPSFNRELEATLRLAQTPACRNLMRLFFQTERAKKGGADAPVQGKQEGSPPADKNARTPTVAVIGAGVMGSGIAQWLAAKNMRVILRDLDAQRVGAGMDRIAKLLGDRRAFKEKEARDAMDRIVPAPAPVPLSRCGLVIEAAVEKMELKKKIFHDLDGQVGPQTILATNTSALSITELSEATKDPGRVVGIHFFNPVHKMQLVEVVVGMHTRPEVAKEAQLLVQKMGKLPVVVKDSPGFVVNRILMPYMLEAARFFDQGAKVAQVDGAMLAFGMPMGPLRLMDEVGLDVAEDVAATLGKAFGARMAQPGSIAPMLKAGLLGRKAGKGFYLHGSGGRAKVNPAPDLFRAGTRAASLTGAQLQERMVLLMVNEAARCLEEGLAQDAEAIDFAMVMGTGFAPFRGGPLRHAETVGVKHLAAAMALLADAGETHYAPCALIEKMAVEGGSFFGPFPPAVGAHAP